MGRKKAISRALKYVALTMTTQPTESSGYHRTSSLLNVHLPAQAISAAQLSLICVCGVLKVKLALDLDQEHGKTLPRLQCSAQVTLPALSSSVQLGNQPK